MGKTGFAQPDAPGFTGNKNARNKFLRKKFTRTWDAQNTGRSPGRPDAMLDPVGSTGGPNSRVATQDPSSERGGSGSGGGAMGNDNSASSVQDLTTPMTGFASQYAPGLTDILYSDPRIMVRDKLKSMGYNTDSGIMDLIGNDADALQYLAMLSGGAQPGSLNSQEDNQFINFAGDWTKNAVTPGGGSMDSSGLMQTILDAPGGSALAAALAGGTPQEQAAMLNNMVQAAAGGMTPLMQRVLGNVMQDRTDDWLSTQAKGENSTLADYLQRGGNGILGR